MPSDSKKSVSELLGVPDPPKTGRERLVAAAIELFYRHGFGAVGIDQVIARAGVTKSTFYKHFEGKDDLMVAAVQRAMNGNRLPGTVRCGSWRGMSRAVNCLRCSM